MPQLPRCRKFFQGEDVSAWISFRNLLSMKVLSHINRAQRHFKLDAGHHRARHAAQALQRERLKTHASCVKIAHPAEGRGNRGQPQFMVIPRRTKVGTSRSTPLRSVGSLCSNGPLVTVSNCNSGCTALAFFRDRQERELATGASGAMSEAV